MMFVRAHRRFAAWLAMLAMVFGVLAPTVAQARLASSDETHWVEVCSASGMVWLQVEAPDADGSEPGSSLPGADMGTHCPWCSFHGSAAGLPADERIAPVLPVPAHPVPAWAGVPPADALWRSAQARAPPPAS